MLKELPSLASTVENATPETLLDLLQNAQVSIGHWRGRMLSVPGYEGKVTFSKFHKQVEAIYQKTLEPMQERQNEYEKKSTSGIDPMPFRGRGAILASLVFLPYTLTAKAVGDAVCWATTPYPEISLEEENEILPVLEWREKIDHAFEDLYQSSQKDIDQRWALTRAVDSFMDTRSAFKNTHQNDWQTLNEMQQIRQKRTALTPMLKHADTVIPVTAELFGRSAELFGHSLLTYAKYRKSP